MWRGSVRRLSNTLFATFGCDRNVEHRREPMSEGLKPEHSMGKLIRCDHFLVAAVVLWQLTPT